jgi:hypothetical protein
MHAQVSAINAAMSSLVKTLNVFPRERTIVTRERSKKARSVPLVDTANVPPSNMVPC